MTRPLPLLPLAFFALLACNKGDKVPSYLDIPSVSLTTTGQQGSATSKITDAWVFADEELIGVWELPARVPVLRDGASTIRVTPGIKRNGMFDDRLRYPFYSSWTSHVEFSLREVTAVQPTVNYISQAGFWIEAFEEPGSAFITSEASDTTLLRFTPAQYPEVVLNNSPCGGFILDADHRYIRIYTDEDFQVPGGPVFLEMDYRNDITFTVGVLFNSGGQPVSLPYVYVVPTTRPDGQTAWNKMYIDLSPVFNQGVTERDIYFEASLPSDMGHGHVYLDNVKLVRLTP
ncbi:MAG: hypothetical protein KIT10_03595 [Flavobacteriales bacterium]|nr:hypothetical protein [Flavobacteriales bacterium]